MYKVIGYKHRDDNLQYSKYVDNKRIKYTKTPHEKAKPSVVVLASTIFEYYVLMAMSEVMKSKSKSNNYDHAYGFTKLDNEDREIALEALVGFQQMSSLDSKLAENQINLIFDMIEANDRYCAQKLDYYFFFGR